MRIAAGILMMVVGLASSGTLSFLVDIFGESVIGISVPLLLLLLAIILGGGIGTFIKKAYSLALVGAICSVLLAFTFTVTQLLAFLLPFHHYAHPAAAIIGTIFPGMILTLIGILAVVFLTKRRGEFQA